MAIQGRIQTGSYKNKNGDTVYTTDVIADRVQFLEYGNNKAPQQTQDAQGNNDYIPQGYEAVEDDLPF